MDVVQEDGLLSFYALKIYASFFSFLFFSIPLNKFIFGRNGLETILSNGLTYQSLLFYRFGLVFS